VDYVDMSWWQTDSTTSSLQQWLTLLPPSSARVSLTLATTHSIADDFNSTFTSDVAANLARGLQLNSTQSASVHQFIHVISLQGCLSPSSRRRRRLLQVGQGQPLQVELVILSTISSIGANWSAVASPVTTNSSTTDGSVTALTLTDVMTGMGSWLMQTVETGQFQANASHIQPLSATVTTLGRQTSSSSSSSSTGGWVSVSSSSGVVTPSPVDPGQSLSSSSSAILSSVPIAGIVVGVIVFILLMLVLAVLVMRALKRASFSGVAMGGGGDGVDGRYAGSEMSGMMGVRKGKDEAPTAVHWTGRTFS
jgi:hypothetical protein